MAAGLNDSVAAPVTFTGPRDEFFGRLFGGYLLMLPTLGVYRFWVTTFKRRFYWSHTVIDGDPLEYTGTARQLLIGFLLAIAFFLPAYIALFVLSLFAGVIGEIGYVVVLGCLWFFVGYAQYRGRDFRLSRTLWRGIRFDQKGSAVAYATRRFLWSLLVVVTLGLAYPFMSASLWRYRYANTWFGDRQVSFEGTWRTIAGPYYRAYAVVAVSVGLVVGLGVTGNLRMFALAPVAVIVLGGLALVYWRSREATRMFSAIRLGPARVETTIKARSLFGQHLAFGLIWLLLAIVAWFAGSAILAVAGGAEGTLAGIRSISTNGWASAAFVVGGYVLTVGAFSLLSETILDFGWWKLVAGGSWIVNVESLGDVRAIDEDRSTLGEGFADALNVGAF